MSGSGPTQPVSGRIVRRDFPLSQDGYDRAAVDAHLAAIAVARWAPGGAHPAADAEFELIASARLLLGQISLMRTELQRVSASLLQQSLTIAEALEQLEASEGCGAPSEAARPEEEAGPPPPDDLPGEPEPGLAAAAGDDLPAVTGPAAAGREELAAAAGSAAAGREELAAETGPAAVEGEELAPLAAAAKSAGPTSEPGSADPDPDRARAEAELEDARLVALDMALGGSTREEIDRELSERFDLAARAALVEAVLAAIA